MQYSVGIEYALHSLFYMIEVPNGKLIRIKELAALHGISETYLSKIFTQLRKNGVVKSTPGVNGGYEIAKDASELSFWDIIEAIEGSSYLFQCAEIRQNNILSENEMENQPPTGPCLIKTVMWEAEEKMRNHLKAQSLLWLKEEVYKDFTKEKRDNITKWIEKSSSH